MDMNNSIQAILSSNDTLKPAQIIDLLLPVNENSSYNIDSIDKRLREIRGCLEDIQRKNNNHFDQILSQSSEEQAELRSLNQNLHKTQLDIMKLDCDIAFTREQYNIVNSIKSNPVVKEKREILAEESKLRISLRLAKFKPLERFFERITDHLETSLTTIQRLDQTFQPMRVVQHFDWDRYHKTICLVRICGQTLFDINRFERLYQSDAKLVSIQWRQPIETIDITDLAEFSMDSLLTIKTELNDGLTVEGLFSSLNLEDRCPEELKEYMVFKQVYERTRSTTIRCCKIIVEQNMNYLDLHLTEGIQIERLNGTESTSDSQVLPLYAFSPQEYITQIGQHLLTLRKQMEQFDQLNSESLRIGLELLDEAQDLTKGVKQCGSVTETLVKCISNLCIRSLLGRTNNSILSKLSPNGRRQLATDALYLDNVLEDLAILDQHSPYVHKFKQLLQVD